MARDAVFVEIFGDAAISDVSDSGKFSMSSRLDQSNSTLSMGSIPRFFAVAESGYLTDQEDNVMDDHPEADPELDHPNDDLPLDQLPEILMPEIQPPFQGVQERFNFWQERGAFDPVDEPFEVIEEVQEEAPEEEPPIALINQWDPHFGLQNPIVQALVIAGLGHIVPAENIVMPMDIDPEEL